MFKYLFLLFWSTTSLFQPLLAQKIGKFDSQIFLVDQNGLPFNRVYRGVEGTPYFINEFKYGTIELKTGRKFINAFFKLDITSEEILFKTPDNEEGIISSQFVKEVVIHDTILPLINVYHFKTDLPSVDRYKSGEFCQILAEGKLTLVNVLRKAIETRKNDFSGEIVKEFSLYEDLYVYQNGEMKRLKKDKGFLLSLMQDQRAKMEEYLGRDKKNLKNPQIIAETFRYYNQL